MFYNIWPRSADYNEVYGESDQYDYKTDYEDVDYSYDSVKKDEGDGKDGDPDYGDFYDYNYEQVSML
jgi:hypothetical protein